MNTSVNMPSISTTKKIEFDKGQIESILIGYFKNELKRPDLADSNFSVITNIDCGSIGISDPLDYDSCRPPSISSIIINFK